MNIFDFDGTLYKGDSTFDFWFYCMKEFPAARKRIPKEMSVALAYLMKRVSLDGFKGVLYEFFEDIPDIDDVVKRFWVCHIDRMRMDVLAFANEGDLVASASPEGLLSPICKELGFNLIASRVDMGSGKLISPNCKGEEKVRRIQSAGLPMHYDLAFSDSLSDLPIMRLADEAYLVKMNKIEPFPAR